MLKKPLQGQTALVTGAAKRVGREIALTLSHAGANIVVHYNHSEDEADELCREIRERGVQALTVQADFEKPEEYEELITQVNALAGRLDILINNASIFPLDTVETASFAKLVENVEVNAWVPFTLNRAFAKQADRGGHIVNLIDSRIKGYDWKHVPYLLSKHVLAAMTAMQALEYAPNIAVNGIGPGLILPPPGKDESYIEKMKDTVPLKRHGDPRDIADATLFLVTSRFITGQVIYVDGGRHLQEYIGGSNPH